MGQNYHLIHHLWPSIPWYNYQPAYYATKPLLDAKGCAQSLGLLQGKTFEFSLRRFIEFGFIEESRGSRGAGEAGGKELMLSLLTRLQAHVRGHVKEV
jgi:beta-carotene hydroxylase